MIILIFLLFGNCFGDFVVNGNQYSINVNTSKELCPNVNKVDVFGINKEMKDSISFTYHTYVNEVTTRGRYNCTVCLETVRKDPPDVFPQKRTYEQGACSFRSLIERLGK